MNFEVKLAPANKTHYTVNKTYDWRNNPDIYQWTRQNAPISLHKHKQWWKSLKSRPDIEMWKVMKKGEHSDSFIGMSGLTSIDQVNRRAEFSLYIDPKEHGKGYGKQALWLLFKHGFEVMNLHLIWGETFEHNPAKLMFEKLGMRCEGVRRDFYYREGKYINAYLYSLTKKEWFDGPSSIFNVDGDKSVDTVGSEKDGTSHKTKGETPSSSEEPRVNLSKGYKAFC